jgi:hypothetical protein
MASIDSRYPVPRTATALGRRTTAGVAVALAAVLLARVLVNGLGLDLGATGAMSPFAVGPLVGTTIVAGVGAAVVYAALVRYTRRPVRNFAAVAAAVFLFMLVPVAVVTPSTGVTPTGQAVLVAYHLLVAVPLVAFVVGVVDV